MLRVIGNSAAFIAGLAAASLETALAVAFILIVIGTILIAAFFPKQ